MEKIYSSEEEFLRDYNPNDFKRLSVTADILIISVSSEESTNYRKTDSKKMSILLVKRDNYPFKDKWCLPGGFVKDNETLDMAADRVLTKETNLHNIYKEQLYTFGDLNRDPRMRVITTAYMALIDKERLTDELSGEASWFNIAIEEKTNETKIRLDNGNDQIVISLKRVIEDETTTKYKYEIIQNDNIAFDHANILMTDLDRIKNKVRDTDIVFNLMPEYFTLGELQQIYEVILGKKLLDPAFRRIIADKVIKTDKTIKTGGHRPSAMYKYKRK